MDNELRRLDYEKTMEYIMVLTDARPKVSGLSLVVLSNSKDKLPEPGIRFTIGVLGLVALCGIAIYDMRNTQLYHAAMFRARGIEASLNLMRFTQNDIKKYANGCLIIDRAGHYGIEHDLGLSIVYGASIAGWIFIILNSISLYQNSNSDSIYVAAPIFILIIISYYIVYKRVTRQGIQANMIGKACK